MEDKDNAFIKAWFEYGVKLRKGLFNYRFLTERGLVVIRKQGRECYCLAKLAKLKEVAEWTNHYRAFWNDKLDSRGSF